LPAALCVIAVLGAAQAVRSLTGSTGLSVAAMFATLVVAGAIAAGPDGPLDVFAVLGRRVVEFGEQLPNDLPPLRETPAVVVMLAVLAMLVAALADLAAFGLRAPAAVLAPIAVLPALTAVLGQPAAPWWAWTLVLALVVVLLYTSARWRRRCEDEARAAVGYTADGRGAGGLSGALVAGLAAIGAAALVAPLLPPASGALWQQLAPVPSLSVNRVNPIIDLGDDLRRDQPTEMLRYATSQTEGSLPYLSLVSLTELEAGSEWRPAEFAGDGDVPGDEHRPPSGWPGTDLVLGGAPQTVNIILNPGVTPYLPHFHPTDVYTDVPADYRRDEATGDVRQVDGEAFALGYHVRTAIAMPSSGELALRTGTEAVQLPGLTELPDDEAALEPIRTAMAQVVDAEAGPYEQALQLQEWFTGGAFDYSEQAPVAGGYDGTNLDVIAAFLEARSGYCVHFASTMAVMGRMLDIPTRIQVGFTPGAFDSVYSVGQPVYTVTTDDLHAWAEFWVPGYGWVPFETTPAEGLGELSVPELGEEGAEAQPTETPEPTEQPVEPTPTEAEPDPADETERPDETDPARTDGEADAAPLLSGPVLAVLGAIAAVALLVALALAAPGFVRRRRRDARRERVEHGRGGALSGPDRELHPAAAAWRETLDTALDHGIALPRGTVGEIAAALVAALAAREADADDGAAPGDPARGEERVGEAVGDGAGRDAVGHDRAAHDRAAHDRAVHDRAAHDRAAHD
ncbi:MAG: transglutaminase domain-containing protein, partial [Microbacteriaceae bacterium]|nr:transglutaminase domain-containing protein [Microbacteriaceae bacterium]